MMVKRKIRLGVNVDHVATVRQARRDVVPDVAEAAKLAIKGGADHIVVHLREDRRHIQDHDVYNIKKLGVGLDLEMAATEEIKLIALDVKPDMVTLVPEKREEITTEGGLDVAGSLERLKPFISSLESSGIRVSLFIDPEPTQIKASAKSGATFIEIHTGAYANAKDKKEIDEKLEEIKEAVKLAKKLGLKVNAGHGLTYNNVSKIAGIEGIEELNIGHNIVARAVIVGMEQAVSEMKKAMAGR